MANNDTNNNSNYLLVLDLFSLISIIGANKMSNPAISFRISEYHLARALHIVRQFEPTYQLTSISHLVKTCFFDYLAKMNLARNNEVPNSIIIEINNLINLGSTSKIDLDDLIQLQQNHMIDEQSSEQSNEQSTISSVSDFSPPSDWMSDGEEN